MSGRKIIQPNFYEKDGVRFDRVTRVLDYFLPPGLVDWKLKNGDKAARTSASALRVGTRVDDLIKRWIEQGEWDLKSQERQEVRYCTDGFGKWLAHYGVTDLKVESTLFCPELGIAGTPDISTADTLIDIKTSRWIDPRYWIQVAIYNYMKAEPKKFLAILRLNKEYPEYQYQVIDYNEGLVDVFASALHLYRYYNENRFQEAYDNGNVPTQGVTQTQGHKNTTPGPNALPADRTL